jgi:hypothetical protein
MTDDAALAEAMDPAVLRAERRLRMLEKLAQLEMELAEALQRQAIAAANPVEPAPSDAAAASGPGAAPQTAGDLSAAFARIARSLRLTLALQARAEEQLRALLAGEAAKVEVRRVEASRRAAAETRSRSDRQRNEVERLVLEAAEREVEDLEALDGVLKALEERLADDEAYCDLDRMPLREVVERLCADLELTPDWSRWEGEGWTPEPPFSRARFSIWARPSRTPLRPFAEASDPAALPAPNARRLE